MTIEPQRMLADYRECWPKILSGGFRDTLTHSGKNAGARGSLLTMERGFPRPVATPAHFTSG